MEFNKHNLESILESEKMSTGKLMQLLYWHNWRKTAIFFFLILMVLWDIAAHSVISVVSVAGVLMLSITIGYCCYVWGMRKLRKSSIMDHPYQRYLETDPSISEEAAVRLTRLVVSKLNPFLMQMRSLFFIEDLLDSLKLLFMLCGLNVIGDYINGMTLLVICFISIFTLPKLYDWKKAMIDKQLQNLQRLKTRLLCTKKKGHTLAPTATVDPQVVSSKLRQKTSGINVQTEYNTGQFIATEEDCDWPQDMPHEDYLDYKNQ